MTTTNETRVECESLNMFETCALVDLLDASAYTSATLREHDGRPTRCWRPYTLTRDASGAVWAQIHVSRDDDTTYTTRKL